MNVNMTLPTTITCVVRSKLLEAELCGWFDGPPGEAGGVEGVSIEVDQEAPDLAATRPI
jgi:hypothetical protein